MMKLTNLLIIGGCLGLQSCTIAINLTHTEGQASDIVDETQTNSPNVDPTLSIPALKFSGVQGATAPKQCPKPPCGANFPSVKKLCDTNLNDQYSNHQQYPKRHRQGAKRPDWTD